MTPRPAPIRLDPYAAGWLVAAIAERAERTPPPTPMLTLLFTLTANGRQRQPEDDVDLVVGPTGWHGAPMTYREAATRLGLSTRTIQRMVTAGRLPTVQIADRPRIPAAAVERHRRGSTR